MVLGDVEETHSIAEPDASGNVSVKVRVLRTTDTVAALTFGTVCQLFVFLFAARKKVIPNVIC